jgi:cobyric acid synthase
MGKKKQEHRKRVAKRNAELKGAQRVYQQMYQEVMKKQIEALREEYEKNKQQEDIVVEDTGSSTGITLNMQ